MNYYTININAYYKFYRDIFQNYLRYNLYNKNIYIKIIMSQKSSELIYENNADSLNDGDNDLNYSKNFLNDSNFKPSIEININELDKYFFLCNFCQNRVPILDISKKGKINYKCECGIKYKDLTIKKFFLEHLFISTDFDSGIEKLKCYLHNDKYIYYCKKCESHYCFKCSKYCKAHKDELVMFGIDDKDTKEKVDYINQKIKNKDIIKVNVIKINEINTINTDIQNNILNDESKENENIIENNISINNENYNEIINIKNESNFDIYEDDKYNYINLFKMIIKDYENFPNYNHLKTISNIERFASLYFIDCNFYKLNYEFNKENIKDNSMVDIFGDIFVNNNEKKCFLIIKEKILELNKEIDLKDFFDLEFIIPPINLDVQLIERKRNVMTKLSFMFNNISTLTDKSNFANFNKNNIKEMIYMFNNCKSKHLSKSISKINTENVTDMNHMFCNCSSLKNLPDISIWNTKNVTDMSYMFNNCTSLKNLPNISNWNTENVVNMQNMFEKCSLITSLPNISKWNFEKVEYMNNMLKNCRKLLHVPSNWEINKNAIITNMFEGDISLDNQHKYNTNETKLFKCYSYLIDIIFKILSCLIVSKMLLILLFFIFMIAYIIIINFIPFFDINNLDKIKESINNPIKYFNLTNNTNITYIAKLNNATNKRLIKEMPKNKELTILINKILNFTLINGNITFNSDYNKYKLYNIAIKYEFFIFLLFIIFIVCNYIYKFKYLDSAKSIYFLIIIFFFNAFFLYFHFNYINIVSKLAKSIREYFYKVIQTFVVEIPKINYEEVEYLESSLGSIIFIIIISIIDFIIIYVLCIKIHSIRDKNYIFYKIIKNN